MALIDPQDIDNSLEDFARQLDQFASTANNFHVKGDDKYTIPVECIFFLNTNGRFPTTHEMTTDEYGLRSMSDIDPVDLRMSSRLWELQVITQGVSIMADSPQPAFSSRLWCFLVYWAQPRTEDGRKSTFRPRQARPLSQ